MCAARQALDPSSAARTAGAVRRFNHSSIRGVFMLGSDPIADQVGDVVVINRPALPWGFGGNASAAAAALSALPRGSVTYAYMNMKSDPAIADAVAEALAPHVRLLGHRELIRVARVRLGYHYGGER